MVKLGYFASGSSLALALTLGLGGTAFAQNAATPAPAPDDEEIVITGSFIRGTPEDAAIPVRTLTLQEIQNLGTPSNLDLVKGMADSGSVRGEGDRRGAGSSVGVQTINLRQLGSNRTLVLLNGRRLQDQSSAGVRFNNTAVVPNNVIGRVDTLRSGGAVNYGSDAIGGVVNFITQHNYDGLQVRSNYRFVEDSDGDYDADFLWGNSSDNGSVIVAGQFQHRSTLWSLDRDWARREYLQNPNVSAWSVTASPGSYQFSTARSATTGFLSAASVITPAGAGLNAYSTTNTPLPANDYLRQMGATGVFRDPGCRNELGMFVGISTTGSPACYYHVGTSNKLAEESDTYNLYSEFNYEFADGLRSHTELVYYQLQVPNAVNTPSEGPGSFAAKVVTCTGPNAPASIGCTTAGQLVSVSAGAYQVSGRNPAVADLLSRFRSQDGNAILTPAQITQLTGDNGGVILTSWRPFAISGSPFGGYTDHQKNRVDQFRASQEFSGDLPKIFGSDLRWTADVTGIHTIFKISARDIMVDRMQDALNGFGDPDGAGPLCAIKTTAGANGCQWFNPFSSAIPRNAFTGESNLVADGGNYNPALANDPMLSRALFEPIDFERQYTSVESNFKVDGDLPIELPGGPIAVAFGGQYRFAKELFVVSALANQDQFGCVIGSTCTFSQAPTFNRANGSAAIFAQPRNRDRNFPAWSAFAAAQFPVFDQLELETSVRYEKFISDEGAVDNSVVAPQGTARWQVFDWLAVRGVASSTFADVQAPENLPPTQLTTSNTTAYGVGAAGSSFRTFNTPNLVVSPEKGFNYNIGFIFEKGPLQLNLDYYNIRIDGYANNLSVANVMNALAANPDGPQTSSAFINCSSPMLYTPQASLNGQPFVVLNSNYDTFAECSAANAGSGPRFSEAFASGGAIIPAEVRYHGLPRNVNGGEFQTDGIDIQSSLTFDDVLGGRLVLNLDATKVLNWDMGAFTFAGATFSKPYDGVGSFNGAGNKGGTGETVFEYKAVGGLNFTHGRHNFNWRTTYISDIEVDTAQTLIATSAAQNVNVANVDTNVVDPTLASCTGFATPVFFENTPTGAAGSGQFGVRSGSSVGVCAQQVASIQGGTTYPASFYSDFTYRVNLPWDTTVTATVQNVFDRDPTFARTADSYNSFLESPTGRTYRVGLSKKF